MGIAEDFTDDFLEHYGVKGMKWGVRRDRSSRSSSGGGKREFKRISPQPKGSAGSSKKKNSSSNRAFIRVSPKPTPSTDKKEASNIQSKVGKKANTSALSNNELKKINERLRLEQEYARLTGYDETKTGKAWIKKTGKEIGQQQIKRVVNHDATLLVDAAIAKGRKSRT